MTLLRRTILIALTLMLVLAVHMTLYAGRPPIARTLSVALPEWPAGQRPLRIALISDLHTAWPGDTPARLEDTVARIVALKPDIVLLAGDALSNHALAFGFGPERSIAALSRLHPPLGGYAVLGNHDYRHPVGVTFALQNAGFQVLDNQAVRVGPLSLIGIADPVTGHADPVRAVAAWRAQGGVPVALMHAPTPIYDLDPDVHVAFAGHTHCGQIALPLIGTLAIDMRDMRYSCGVLHRQGRTSVVTAGLGASKLPFRLGVPPDFWIVTLGPVSG